MSVLINATTTQGLLVTPDNSGQIQFQLNGVNVPSPTTVPTFSAYYTGSGQSLSGATTTKIIINTKDWDTANCFDATTNYRYTPNVAGYYQVFGQAQLNTAAYTNSVDIFKNGSPWRRGTLGTTQDPFCSCLVYLNGTTDYIEMFVYLSSATTTQSTQTYQTYFQACLARPA
jgi:hypothetical protein